MNEMLQKSSTSPQKSNFLGEFSMGFCAHSFFWACVRNQLTQERGAVYAITTQTWKSRYQRHFGNRTRIFMARCVLARWLQTNTFFLDRACYVDFHAQQLIRCSVRCCRAHFLRCFWNIFEKIILSRFKKSVRFWVSSIRTQAPKNERGATAPAGVF